MRFAVVDSKGFGWGRFATLTEARAVRDDLRSKGVACDVAAVIP